MLNRTRSKSILQTVETGSTARRLNVSNTTATRKIASHDRTSPCRVCTDDEMLRAGLAQGTDSNFYGATRYGGANNAGTLFEITTKGKLTLLYSFCPQSGCTDGIEPQAAPMQATDGTF